MKWYVLQVMSGKERSIANELQNVGIHALVPVEERTIRVKGEWISKEYILFSSYVFIEVNFDASAWYKVSNIPNVIKWLGDQKEPTPLPYLEVEWIRMLSNEGKLLKPSDVIVHQDGSMEVLKGILCLFKGKIKSFNKRQRRCEVYLPMALRNQESETITLSINIIQSEIETETSKTVDSSCDVMPEDIKN